jgi:hypothetical protein
MASICHNPKNKTMKHIRSILLLILLIPKLSKAQDEKPQAIERACPNVFNITKNSKKYAIRYASNHAIDEQNKNIKQLVIYIHGARRNGLDYYEWGEKAVKAANKNEETLFISPQFNSEKDLEDHKQDATHLFWANNNWRIGDESVNGKKRSSDHFFSSFSLIDSMIMRVCNKKIFPKLKKIIVVGHSAGGQFVSRYLGMTPMPNLLTKYNFRFIVMNPSTYLYLDDRRPLQMNGKLAFVKTDSIGCDVFDEYPRGMKKLNPYAAKIGAETIKKHFLSRDVAFVLGGNDVNINDSSLDKSCGGNLQGRFRLERGQLFYEYIQLFSPNKKVHQLAVVPNVAHDGDKMINSDAALSYIFDF